VIGDIREYGVRRLLGLGWVFFWGGGCRRRSLVISMANEGGAKGGGGGGKGDRKRPRENRMAQAIVQ